MICQYTPCDKEPTETVTILGEAPVFLCRHHARLFIDWIVKGKYGVEWKREKLPPKT